MRIGEGRRRSSNHYGATYADSQPNLEASIFSNLDFNDRRELADIRLSFDEVQQHGLFTYRKSQSKIKDFSRVSLLADDLQLTLRLYGPD
jgi:hypothetical protein